MSPSMLCELKHPCSAELYPWTLMGPAGRMGELLRGTSEEGRGTRTWQVADVTWIFKVVDGT